MKCDRCESPATVHEVTIRHGQRVERHLCESCARGQPQPAAEHPASPPDLAATGRGSKAGETEPSGPAARATPATCPACGLAYSQFKHDGMLGCADCYDVFEAALGPMLERAHEGGTHHVGRVPTAAEGVGPGSSGGSAPGDDRQRRHTCEGRRAEAARRCMALRSAMEEAVRGEEYERAAQLRDELKRLEAQLLDDNAGRGADT